jgi:hypothetical protein
VHRKPNCTRSEDDIEGIFVRALRIPAVRNSERLGSGVAAELQEFLSFDGLKLIYIAGKRFRHQENSTMLTAA